MGYSDTSELVSLDRDKIRALIAKKELPQWWFAEQLGVHRKTLMRWLSGATRRVHRDKAITLAWLLDCELEDIALEHLDFATDKDTLAAAKSLIDSTLLEQLMPANDFKLYEDIAKGVASRGLNLRDRGRLFCSLGIALWRQSKFEESRVYVDRALEIANKIGDENLRVRAAMQTGHFQCWRGDLVGALNTYLSLSDVLKVLGTPNYAANLSNIGDVHWLLGNFDLARRFQYDAIAEYERFNLPINLASCYLNLSQLDLELGEREEAKRDLDQAVTLSRNSAFQRGLAACDLGRAELLAQTMERSALTYLDAARGRFATVNINEPRTLVVAARVYRTFGHFEDARQTAEEGLALAISRQLPIEEAFIRLELHKLDRVSPDGLNEPHLDMCLEIFERAGAKARVAALADSR